MALREEFEAQGAFLFRWRSFLPLALLALAIPSFISRPAGEAALGWQLACLGISVFGFVLRVATVAHAPRGTSGRNTKRQKAAEFTCTGMCSIVRHPLYLGNLFMWIGASMLHLPWLQTALLALAFWIYYERIMFAEEEFLREKFGEPYLIWASQTPAFVPHVWKWRRPALPFSLRSALKREYAGFAALILTFAALDLCRHRASEGVWRVGELWQALAPLAVVSFFALRFLKHRTTLLHVPGR
jgi:protein-S-isoprenylcysteine O-methyltransferase Ste14